MDKIHFPGQMDGNQLYMAQEMINISNNPVLMPRMPFGKHNGMLFSEVRTDYLQWLSATELDEDMAYTVKHHLGISANKHI